MTIYGTRRALLGRRSRYLTFTATTTGAAETVSIARLTTDVTSYIDWGDGTRSTLVANAGAAREHTYAVAGTYKIRVHRAEHITQIWIASAKFGGLDTAQLRWSRIRYFVLTLATGCTVRSEHMIRWRPIDWQLYSMPAGTFNINSAHMSAWPITGVFSLRSMPAGTYNIDSAHMSAWRPREWYLFTMPAGSYAVNTAHMTAWNPQTWLMLSMPSAGSSYTFAASCMRAWTGARAIRADGLGLADTVVDTILTDINAGKATYTYATPTLNVAGTNAAPTGTYQDRCPPTSGLETVYALANGNCDATGPEWSITYTGGTAP